MIARRVAVAAASNLAGKVFGLVTWFLLTPFILSRLGATDYGIWVLVGSLAAYGYLLDLGIAGAVIKFVAEHASRDEWERAHTIVATALWLYRLLAVAVVVLGGVLALLVPRIFTIPAGREDEAAAAVALFAISVALSIAFMPANATLRGLQRYDLHNLVLIAGNLLTAGAIVAVLSAGGGLLAIVAVNIPVALLSQAANVALIRRTAPQLRFSSRGRERAEVRRIVGFSGASSAMQMSGYLQTKTDEIVVAAALPIARVTTYSLARRLSELPMVIADQFVKVLMPMSSALHARGDTDRLRSACLLSTRLSLAIFVPPALVIVVFAAPILSAWVGKAHTSGAPLVGILTAAAFFRALSWPSASLLQGMGRHRRLAVLSVGSGVANLALSLLLVRRLGVAGVAYGTLLPTAVEAVLILAYALPIVGISIRDALRQMLLPPLLPVIPMVGVMALLDRWLQTDGIGFVVPGTLGAAVYAAGYLLLGATRPERALALALLQSPRRRSADTAER